MALRILFAGYAPVHFVCFLPAYRLLAADPRVELWLTGGFKRGEEGAVSYQLDGFYDRFDGLDRSRIIPLADAMARSWDVCVCAHLSDAMVPPDTGRTVQVFHGVSFKNFAVREKALNFNYLCLPGAYHAALYRKRGLVPAASEDGSGPQLLITGFPKVDPLRQPLDVPVADRRRGVGLADPSLPTLMYAPTGGKHNSLELRGEELVQAVQADGRFNLLVKPHDHPKKAIDWYARLSRYENDRMRLVRDWDIVPWLTATDLLITDASSVATEFTLLDRPIVFMDVPRLLAKVVAKGAPLDLDTYGRHIGRLIPTNAPIVHGIDAALNDPSGGSDKRRAMANDVFHKPGSAADRVAHVVRLACGLESSIPADALPVLPDTPANSPASSTL